MKKILELEYEAEDREANIIDQIQELAAEIGWGIAISGDESDEIDHIIIGQVEALIEIDRTMEVYEIFEPPTEESSVVH